jgi:prevent-host-death family protein
MRVVGAREANQNFSELLREVEGGREVTITRHGKPVARLLPARPKPVAAAERRKAVAEMVKLMKKGIDLGGRSYTRDEMHEP